MTLNRHSLRPNPGCLQEGQTPGALAKAYGQEDTAAMLG